jgi:gamma-glutamyl hydrolase
MARPLLAAAVVLLLVMAGGPAAAQAPAGPVIGVLTQPLDGLGASGSAYIAASYVKYLETAGARVVPVLWDAPAPALAQLMGGLNGLLLPGGGVYSIGNASSPFLAAARALLDQALQFNAAGDYFPVWGTCMGFEMLAMLVANSTAPRTCGARVCWRQ